MNRDSRRRLIDKISKQVFFACSLISGIMVVLILAFIVWQGIRVFLPTYPNQQSLAVFLGGFSWRADRSEYGVLFIVINTLISAFGAGIIAFPLSILSALFIVKIAPSKIAFIMTTIIELLAAIPSVVFGVFAAGRITTLVDQLAYKFNYSSFGGNSVLAVILLLSIMIYPTITTLAIAAIKAVPTDLENASLALGASPTQTNFKVVLKSAKSGLTTGLILGLGRAFGEATAVSMVAGNATTGPSLNPFEITRTLTSTMLSGLHETSGLDYDIRFSVGLVLMLVILLSNVLIQVVRRRIVAGGVQ